MQFVPVGARDTRARLESHRQFVCGRKQKCLRNSGGMREIRVLKSKTPRRLSGRAFLRGRVYTTFYFFVKGNLKLFLFSIELVSFQEHSSPIPQPIFPCAAPGLARVHASRGGYMPHYLSQVSYTPEAWARLVAHPQDRIEAVRAPIEKLGGRIHNAFFAFGEFDVVVITEMPDNVSAAAIAIAFAAGGSVKSEKTTPLMTSAEALEAIKKAGTTGHRSLTASASAAAARPGRSPRQGLVHPGGGGPTNAPPPTTKRNEHRCSSGPPFGPEAFS